MSNLKTAFIHGRPGPHPTHRKFAESIGAEFHHVDFKMRWQDKKKSSFYRIVSSFVCAVFFSNRKKYDVFLVDNLHFMPVIMKSFGLLRKNQKIVVHLASHTLYFMYSHRFSKFTEYLHKQALKRYDALICEGKVAETLAKKILGDKTPKTYCTINGIPTDSFPKKESDPPALTNKNILFVGNGPGKERLWYKGLDLMLNAFFIAKKTEPDLDFTIVGNWEEEVIKDLANTYDAEKLKSVHFKVASNDLEQYFSDSSLYLHCARGEAWGLTILLAMANGVPPLVSDWTGAKEVVEQIDGRLIVPLDATQIADKILWYFNLSASEKNRVAEKCKNTVLAYTEEKAITDFKKTFESINKDFFSL